MVTENIVWGLRRSMAVAAGFAAFVIVEYLLLGPRTTGRIGVTLPAILSIYVCGGLAAGIVLGVGRPWAKIRVGAVIIGVFVGICVYGSAGIIIDGLPSHWDGAAWFAAILVGGIIGAFGGNKFFDDHG
jgi:hypothetical protein